jgi:ABC-2 type transport system permease protein
VAIDFARPISLKYAAMFTAWGQALFSAVFSGIPMVLLGSLIWGFKLPEHAGQWFFFALSVLLAVCLVSSFDYLMGLSVFWLKTDFHISWIMGALMALFSGMAIPLWFYPPTLRAIANFLPFRFYLYEPVAILIGRTTGADLVQVLLWQVFWIVLLNAIGYAIWQKARQVVVVQGG